MGLARTRKVLLLLLLLAHHQLCKQIRINMHAHTHPRFMQKKRRKIEEGINKRTLEQRENNKLNTHTAAEWTVHVQIQAHSPILHFLFFALLSSFLLTHIAYNTTATLTRRGLQKKYGRKERTAMASWLNSLGSLPFLTF